MVLTGTYDARLVALSLALAGFAAYTALSVAHHIRASAGWARRVWLAGAAAALGGGIWSMHFVAMLALRMPGGAMGYDGGLTLLSLGLAILFTAAGFALLAGPPARPVRLVAAGLLMGSGIVAMHYVGMAAMRGVLVARYDPGWVALSVVIAVLAATGALWLAFREGRAPLRPVSALAMGAGIAGMHFAGMRAAVFRMAGPGAGMNGGMMAHDGAAAMGQTYLAGAVGVVTIVILLLALGAGWLDDLFTATIRDEARAALRLRIADVLRDSLQHDALAHVARLMGEHFGASRTGYGRLDADGDEVDYEACWTDGSVPPLLGPYPATAFGVKIVEALKQGRTVVVSDLLAADLSDEQRTRETARAVDTRAVLVVPFLREGRLGSIVYLNDRRPRDWSADEIAFMRELAERTQIVIERHASDRQLRALNAELEARVEARTAELRVAQEALLQSQKMEAIGQLSSGIAHDFNNLLASVVSAFQLIRRRADNPEQVRHFVAAGLEAAERGSKLTGQLLSFSRLQAIRLQPVVVCDVITGIADMLRRAVGPMTELAFDLNPRPVPVLGDATQIEMMLLNLAINARDAMPDGGTVTIRTRLKALRGDPELGDGDYVALSVADTGIGMDAETLRRAMDPFFTTKPVGKGTGLGLSQIYGSVRNAGGSVRITSAPARGTTVEVLLARAEAHPDAMATAPGDDPAAAAVPLTILAVDDDDSLRHLLVQILTDHGHTVFAAASGAEGLAMLDRQPVDVVLLDFAMPGMNGAEVARRIRERWPDLAVMFVSGFADTRAIHAALGPGATILPKPLREEDLLGALARAVRQRPAAARPGS